MDTSRPSRLVRGAAFAAISFFMALPVAHADNGWWNTTTGTWSDATKWWTTAAGSTLVTAVPTTGQTATFNGTGVNGDQTIYLDGNRAVSSLVFANSGATTLLGGVAATPASNTLTLGGTAGITVSAGAGAVTIGSSAAAVPITFGTAQTWTNNSSNTLTIANQISPAGFALTKAGTGRLSLVGSSTFGTLTVSAGSVRLGNSGITSTGLTISNGSSLDLAADMTLGGNITFNNSGGSISSSGGKIVLQGATIRVVKGATAGSSNTISAVISGSGGLTTYGGSTTGAIVLSGANTYSNFTQLGNSPVRIGVDSVGTVGSITSSAFGIGTLSLSGGAESGSVSSDSTAARTILNPMIMANANTGVTLGSATLNGKLTFLAGLNLSVGPRSFTANSEVEFAGTISNGGLRKLGTALMILSGSSTYSGTTSIEAGTLQLGNGGTSGSLNASSPITGLAAGTLAFNRSNTITQGTDFASVIDGAIGVTKRGSGTLLINGLNTYSGTTTVEGGMFHVTSTGSINNTSSVVVNGVGAEFRYNAATALTKPLSLTRGTLSGTGSIATGISVGSNAILSPGNSPGVQTYQSGTFAAGGSYTWEINNWASGTPGVTYDQAVFTDGLVVTASSGAPFTINLTSLDAGNAAGAVPGFNSGLTGLSFNIATGAMTGFSPSAFALGTSSFFAANTVAGNANGGFWLSTNSGSTVLTLNYAPSARYTLAATPAAAAIYAGSTTTITGSIANSTADRSGADSMLFSNLSVGTGPLSVTSGSLAAGAGTAGTVSFSSGSAGLFTFTPTVSATNVNLGTAAVAGTVTSGTVAVWNPAAVNTLSAVSLGSIRVNDTFGSSTLTIQNTAAQGLYTEVLGAAGSASGLATLTGSVSALAGGSSSTAISVGLGGSMASAGVKSGTAAISFTSSGGPGSFVPTAQTIAVTGTVWNSAAATIASGTSVNFGTVLRGTSLSQALSISNAAPNGGFSEKLDAAFGTLSGNATTNSGSFSLLAAGSTSTALAVGLDSVTAGARSGSVQLNFTSNGDGTSGLAPLALDPQTVSLAATVLDPALPSWTNWVSGSASSSLLLISLGEHNQGAGSVTDAFSIWNLVQTAGYTADLDLVSITADGGNTGSLITDLAEFSGLASGSSNPFTASLSLATTGLFSNTWTLAFKSSSNSTQFNDSPRNLTLQVTGSVVIVPEPGALALAGVGVGLVGLALRKRRHGRAAGGRQAA